ncbi:MAG: MFS transporter [Verrucomicrobiota bacterium]
MKFPGSIPKPTGPLSTASPEPEPLRLRWLMLSFAFLATLINYLDRQVLSVVAASPDFQAAVPLTEETYGYVASAFMLAYAVSNGLSGPFIDRVGTRVGYACCMAWWSVAGILHACAQGALSLGGCRLLLGMGEAGNWPAAAKLVSEWFPSRERALASGIFNSGASLGAVASPLVVVWMVTRWGWRSAFVVMGLLGLVWMVAWWFTYRVPRKAVAAARELPISPRQLWRTRFVIFFTLSKVFMDPVWYFFVFWFPKYLSEVHQFSLRDIGWKAWIPYFTAALGNLAGGALTGWWLRRGVPPSTARKASTAVFALLMLSTIPAILTGNSWLSIAFVSLTTFGYTGYTANTLAFPAEVFPQSTVASIWGLASMGSGFGGMLFMALSGWLIERYGYLPVFIGYGVLPLLALSVLLFLLGPLRPPNSFQSSASAAAG